MKSFRDGDIFRWVLPHPSPNTLLQVYELSQRIRHPLIKCRSTFHLKLKTGNPLNWVLKWLDVWNMSSVPVLLLKCRQNIILLPGGMNIIPCTTRFDTKLMVQNSFVFCCFFFRSPKSLVTMNIFIWRCQEATGLGTFSSRSSSLPKHF